AEGGAGRRETFVIADEEATRERRGKHVERSSQMDFIAEGRSVISRADEPVVRRQRRRVAGLEVAEVVVRHTDDTARVDIDARREGRLSGRCADRTGCAPPLAAIGGSRKGDLDHTLLQAGIGGESGVLPDGIELAGVWVDG